MRKLLSFLLVVLLMSVESSLQTSIIWDRSTAWTPWLYKVGPLTIADMITIAVAAFTLLHILHRSVLPRSAYLGVCLLALVYLYLGFIYNLGVYTFWKTFLYDVKVVLYLTVPYLFFYISRNSAVVNWFTPKHIFIFGAIAAILDFAIVHIWGQSEYPSYLGLPPLLPLVPLPVTIVGLLFARRKSHKALFLLLFSFELVSTINRLSLGSLFNAAIALGYIVALRFRVDFKIKFVSILLGIMATNLVAVILLADPFHIPLLAPKAEGALTRQIQLENAVLNFSENIPGVIGKGLGSTWFEHVPIPSYDVYSVGTSVGKTAQESLAMPVKFIFNFGPAALLYKWGVLGTVLLAFFIAQYFERSANKLRQLGQCPANRHAVRYSYAVLIISSIFVIENFTYIGILKTSLITSLLAFYVEHNIQRMSVSLKVSQE